MPAIPAGGTAFKSMATLTPAFCHPADSPTTPGASAEKTAALPEITCPAVSTSGVATGTNVAVLLADDADNRSQIDSARWSCRDAI